MKNSALFFFFFIIVFITCAPNSLSTYTSEKGYSFDYNPNEWDLKADEEITLLFKKVTDKEDFNININILVQDLTGQPMSLEDYHRLTLNQMEQALGRNTVQDEKEIQIFGVLAKEIIYTMPQNMNMADSPELKLKQVYFIQNNKAYLITYTAKMGDFPTFLKSANQVFETFKTG